MSTIYILNPFSVGMKEKQIRILLPESDLKYFGENEIEVLSDFVRLIIMINKQKGGKK